MSLSANTSMMPFGTQYAHAHVNYFFQKGEQQDCLALPMIKKDPIAHERSDEWLLLFAQSISYFQQIIITQITKCMAPDWPHVGPMNLAIREMVCGLDANVYLGHSQLLPSMRQMRTPEIKLAVYSPIYISPIKLSNSYWMIWWCIVYVLMC